MTTATAGATQVEGARAFATLNIGGSTTTTVSFVVGVRR
jgi:acetyl-CoA C-acetyltransferase